VQVEVAYASKDGSFLVELEVAPDCTVEQAIRASGVLSRFPEIDLQACRIGVFSERRTLQDRVRAGDRVEIYRPLLIDPKEARRLRARGKAKG
jgi:putative ubiquitin-RnfH superfamily antitoxin RatB of RatAB toxin-antitoxin module